MNFPFSFQPGESVQIVRNTTDPQFDYVVGQTAIVEQQLPDVQYSFNHKKQPAYAVILNNGRRVRVLHEEIVP